MAATNALEVNRLAGTIEAWWPAIEAAIVTVYSNARSEGYNAPAQARGTTRSASAIRSTNDAAYAGRAPVSTDGPQL